MPLLYAESGKIANAGVQLASVEMTPEGLTSDGNPLAGPVHQRRKARENPA
jgi:hypothetical protein